MIDPVTAPKSVAPQSHLQLVDSTPATPAGQTSATPGAAVASDGPAGASARPATRVYVARSDAGVYVYRLVDVVTGRVLAELPRAESGSLKVLDGYEPGAMASASV